jgi:hypothetical protein
MNGERSLAELLDWIEKEVETKGLDFLNPGQFIGNVSRVRRFELAAAINRLRSARMNR